jgi:hypothetical protein
MASKLLLFTGGFLLILLVIIGDDCQAEARSAPEPGSPRTPEEIAAHKHRVMKMIEVAEKEELLALEWLMEDMNDKQLEEWRETESEQAARFDKLSKKYGMEGR